MRSKKPHSIAIAGAGVTSFNNAKDLLDDTLGFQDEVPESDETRILLVLAGEFMDGLVPIVEWLDDWMLAYDVLLEDRRPHEFDGAPQGLDVDAVIENADSVYKMSAYVNQMTYAGAIANWFEERDGDLKSKVILWSEGSDELNAIVKQCHDAMSFDLTSGLDVIEIEEDPVQDSVEAAEVVVRGELQEVAEPLADEPEAVEPVEEVTEAITEVRAEVGSTDPTSIGTWTQFADEHRAQQRGINVSSDTTTLATLDPNILPVLISSVDSAISQLTAIRSYLELSKVRSLTETAEFLSGSGKADTTGVITVKPEEEDVVTHAPRRRGRPRRTEV